MRRKYARKIIFVAEQRGGLDVFLPVIKKIKSSKKLIPFLFSDNKLICEFAKKHNVVCKYLAKLSLNEIDGIIKKINPNLVFTDTSGTNLNSSISKQFIRSARDLNKLTASLIDYWNKYRERLGKNLEYLADNILVTDNEMEKSLIDIGVPADLIKVTGNPRFDRFSKMKIKKVQKGLIVFYSQPRYNQKPDEIEIFKDLADAVGKFHPNKQIIIKFHPTREANSKDRSKYDNIIGSSIIKIKKADNNIGAEDLSGKAELVAGINSTALFDASLMKKRVISYQPGGDILNDTLKSNSYDWSRVAYDKISLYKEIKNIFERGMPKGKKQRGEYTKNNSTNKVINFLLTKVIN